MTNAVRIRKTLWDNAIQEADLFAIAGAVTILAI
jgi:hypothetical protein